MRRWTRFGRKQSARRRETAARCTARATGRYEIEGKPILLTAGLSKRYGDRWAVRELDLCVPKGEVFGFLGPNGAGKTTTIRMMLGLIRPSSGSVLINGIDARKDPLGALAGVGAIVEAPAFYGYLSGRQNLEILGRISGGVEPQRIDEVLDIVGLLLRADDRVRGYSQGMRQRLGIAQALLARPDIIILDEPTNGLDPSGMREIRRLITRLAGEFGITVFISSHLLYEVQAVCSRVAVISSGRLVAQGKVENLLKKDAVLLEVKVSDPAGALEALKRMDFVSGAETQDDGVLTMQVPTERLAQVNRTLVESGLDVYSFTPRSASLEEFFLDLTGDRSADRSGPEDFYGEEDA